MKESQLILLVKTAHDLKPKQGEECNHCGWCCLTEVCSVGVELTGSSKAPCNLLESENGKHYCKLSKVESFNEVLGLGEGCCAITQQEVIESAKVRKVI